MKLDIRRAAFSTASIIAFTAVSGTAFAQEEGVAAVDADNIIVVTGTNIRGAKVVGSAVQTIDSESIAQSGKSNIADIMRELPNNLAGGVATSDEVQSGQDTGAGSANLAGGQGVNLRGLGALSTLVLINGRRAPASGQFGDFVDISNLPTVAIDRVEVLLDGASAVYGSDAVGGVVNMVLATEAENPVTTLRIGTATQGGGTEYLLGHLQPFNWSTGNFLISGEYYRREAVRATDRDPYRNGSDFSQEGGVDWRSFTARFAPAANIFGGTAAIGSNVIFTVPEGVNAMLAASDLIPSNGVGNTVNVYDRTDILPQVERYTGYAAFNQELGDSIELYGNARYSHRENKSELGYAPLLKGLPSSSPFYIPGVVAANGNIQFGTLIDDRPETREAEVDSYSGTFGVRAELFSDWQLDTAVTYAAEDQHRLTRQVRTANLRPDIITCALAGPAGNVTGCAGLGIIALNPFSTAPLTEAQLDQYFGVEDLTFNSDVWQISGKIDGTLFDLPGGGVKLAAGAEWRREAIEGQLYANTIQIAENVGPYTRTQRDALSFFGELQIPLIDEITINVAGRYEDFEADYGSKFSDFNPKVGVDFNVAEGLRLRASWGTSFHAPPMRFENDDPQPLPGGNAAFILNTSRFGPCNSSLVNFNGLVTNGGQCSFSLIINSGGAGAGKLKPESAETWSLGLDFAPPSIPGLRLSLGYFNITVKDRIERIESGELNAILAEFFATGGGGPFASAITLPTAAEAQAIIDSGKFLGTFGL